MFVSRSFDLIEGHWECERHAVMPGCLCQALLREEGVTHLQNGETWNQSSYQVLLQESNPFQGKSWILHGKGFIQQGRWWPHSFGIVKGDHDWLSWARSHDKQCILCRQIEAATPGIERKMQGKLTCVVLLLQDKACARMAQVAMTAATECGFEILPHPPYSPDMAPSDFCLFPKLKSHLRGTQFGSNEGIIEAENKYLWDQDKSFYFKEIRKREQRWAKCIALNGGYIEK